MFRLSGHLKHSNLQTPQNRHCFPSEKPPIGAQKAQPPPKLRFPFAPQASCQQNRRRLSVKKSADSKPCPHLLRRTTFATNILSHYQYMTYRKQHPNNNNS